MKKFFITVIAAVSMTSCGFGPYLTTYSGAYPFTFRQPIKHKNSL